MKGTVAVTGRLENRGTMTQMAPIALAGSIHNASGGTFIAQANVTGAEGLIENHGILRFQVNPITVNARVNNPGETIATLGAGVNARLAGPVDQFDPVAGTLVGGSWQVINGTLTLGNGELIRLLDANLQVHPSATFTNVPRAYSGSFTNKGVFSVVGGDYDFSGGFDNQGTVVVQDLARLKVGSFTNSGRLEGNGRIIGSGRFFYSDGRIRPGRSPGTLTIEGDVEFSPLAVLEAEIQGKLPDLEYDVLTVVGSIVLDGLLEIDLPLGAATHRRRRHLHHPAGQRH